MSWLAKCTAAACGATMSAAAYHATHDTIVSAAAGSAAEQGVEHALDKAQSFWQHNHEHHTDSAQTSEVTPQNQDLVEHDTKDSTINQTDKITSNDGDQTSSSETLEKNPATDHTTSDNNANTLNTQETALLHSDSHTTSDTTTVNTDATGDNDDDDDDDEDMDSL